SGRNEIGDVRTATEASGKTRIRLATDPGGLGTEHVRVRSLTAAGHENLTASASDANHLGAKAPASTVRYAQGDLLRLTQGANKAAVRTDRLEAQPPLDSGVPPGLREPLEVFRAEPGGAFAAVTRDDPSHLTFPDGQTPPNAGDAILVKSGATTV